MYKKKNMTTPFFTALFPATLFKVVVIRLNFPNENLTIKLLTSREMVLKIEPTALLWRVWATHIQLSVSFSLI
jgi:hypothetical protein